MHTATLLQDLAIVMLIAGIVAFLCYRFKQPVVLGYILAGVIIGPHTPPFPLIQDQTTISTLSDLGILFLMFALGLEFSLRKLGQVGAPALFAATIEIPLMLGIGFGLGRFLEWPLMDCLFLGGILSISSTTIIVKALGEAGKLREPFARMVFGILIVEDIVAVILLALLSGVARTGTLQGAEAAATIGRLVVFLVVSLVLGLILVPRLIHAVAKFRSSELLLVVVLGLCFGFSLLTVKMGYSSALGAFLMGAMVAESREIKRIETLTHPIRDLFVAVFFVAVGLQINPALLWEHKGVVILLFLAVVAGKFMGCTWGTFFAGHDLRTSTRVGMSMAQIGEFSFVIAALGLSLKVTGETLYPIAVSVSAMTAFTTPYFIRGSDALAQGFERRLPKFIRGYLNFYTQGISQIILRRKDSAVQKILNRIFTQLGIFSSLIAGALIAAVFIAKLIWTFIDWAHPYIAWIRAGLWLVAIFTTMPVIIASFRKLRALGMILAELSVSENLAGKRKQELRAVFAGGVLVVGMGFLSILITVLSWAILPPGRFLWFLVPGILVFGWFLRDAFNAVYFQGKAALVEIFDKPMEGQDED
jgi:monovalent cation:H+ antiporter-2, CPA2 family